MKDFLDTMWGEILIVMLCMVIVGVMGTIIKGCDSHATSPEGYEIYESGSPASDYFYRVVDGHEYLHWRSGYRGGIAHSPKCPCFNNPEMKGDSL